MQRSRINQPDSDDDSDLGEEEEEKIIKETNLPIFPESESITINSLHPSSLHFVEVIHDETLLTIAEQLQIAEQNAETEVLIKLEQWEKQTVPELQIKIDKLEKQIDKVKEKLDNMSSSDDELYDILDDLMNEKKKLLRSLYFPSSVHTMANTAGIFIALDDCWLKHVRGRFSFDLIPAMGEPEAKMIFCLNGESENNGSGVFAKLNITNFHLKGESVLIPSLNYDELDLDIEFTVTIIISFDVVTKKWIIHNDDFKIILLKFETSAFALTKSIVSTIISIITPSIQRKVLKELPCELGMFVSSLPCPLQIHGNFNVEGEPYWEEVLQPLVSSLNVCNLMNQTPCQILNFHAIQKSMQRSDLLISLSDVIKYYRKWGKTSVWKSIVDLWNDAALAYYALTCKFEPSDTADDPSQQEFTSCLSFEKIIEGTLKSCKIPVLFQVNMKTIEGQIGIKSILEQSNLFVKRMIYEMTRSQDNKLTKLTTAEEQLLSSMKELLHKNTDLFQFILEKVDFMQGRSSVHVESGQSASLTGLFENLSGQFPVALWTALPSDKIIGGNIIVPTLTKLKTTKEGILNFNFYQLGSIEMLEKCNLHKWFSDDLPDEAHLTAIELAELNIYKPSFSFIIDQTMSLQRGAALFTVQVGPLENTWVPEGSNKNTSSSGRKYLADIKSLGESCPILVQTSDQIKMLGKVPKVTTSVNLAALVAFVNKHFDDIDVLLDVISLTTHAKRENCLQYINFSKIVLSILTKYVLKPGLELDVNMSTRVISNTFDIIICLENRSSDTNAFDLKAKIDFREIFTDLHTLRTAIFNTINHKNKVFK